MSPNTRRFFLCLIFATICLVRSLAGAPPLDILTFGDTDSEQGHDFVAENADRILGGLGEAARCLLPPKEAGWQGGRMVFTLKVDPEKQNYLTIRLWGGDAVPNLLLLYCEGKQVGYRHLGDIETFDIGHAEPALNGRFYYRTTPLPESLTRGRNQVRCELRATGPIWSYGTTFEKYQKPMATPTRGLYRIYTHTDGFFEPPPGEKQGVAPAAKLREKPDASVLVELKERVNREVSKLLSSDRVLNQMQMQFLARAYHVKWTHAYRNSLVIQKILAGGDALYAEFTKDKRVAEFGPATYNPDWFGLGPVGDCVWLLEDELRKHFAVPIPDASGHEIPRKDAWTKMLKHSRDWHRQHRRLYTNQSMINDLYIYAAHRGVAVLDPGSAIDDVVARRYLYESVGLLPWRGSEDADGKPLMPVGGGYYQLTEKGLTRELGYVGNYGEVLSWVTQIYDVTRPKPGKPGNKKIRTQLEKIARARSYFRYPALDEDGNRAMRMETVVGWRDVYFPGDVTYGERVDWDGSALYSAATTLDEYSVGYAQQMFSDNQFFASVQERMKDHGFRVTVGLLPVPDQYELLKDKESPRHRLPMSEGQPDFVFSDEQAGVVAVKQGNEIFYASLYWRARHAVNFLGRVHLITPGFDRIAVVKEAVEFVPNGTNYTRPNWTNFGFGNGGPRYPGEQLSAHAGEVLPVAKIPEGVPYKSGEENIYAGRGDFYVLRYGPYTVAMNMSEGRKFDFVTPVMGRDLTDGGKRLSAGTKLRIAPRTTLVLRAEEIAQ